MINSAAKYLGAMAMTWAVAGLLPLPILVASDPAGSADIACLYLGLGCAWLVTEIYRFGGLPASRGAWRAKTLAISVAVATNTAIFILFGVAAGVQTHFPFPLMAMLAAIPAVGLVPWLIRRVHHPYAAIVLGGMLVLAAKLAGCVVARIADGPDYMAQGYVSADWRSAKLMISLFWFFSTSLSLALLLADYISLRREFPTKAVTGESPAGSSTPAGGAV
jgi:hypothetical protein